MTIRLHSVIIATSIAATAAVGFASAAVIDRLHTNVAEKADRLPVTPDTNFVTVEAREPGVSILNRLPATN